MTQNYSRLVLEVILQPTLTVELAALAERAAVLRDAPLHFS